MPLLKMLILLFFIVFVGISNAQTAISASVVSRVICSTQRLHWPTQVPLRGRSTSTIHVTQYITVTNTQYLHTLTDILDPVPFKSTQTSTVVSTTTSTGGEATVTSTITAYLNTQIEVSTVVVTTTLTSTSPVATVYTEAPPLRLRDRAGRKAPSGQQPVVLNASFALSSPTLRFGWNYYGFRSSDFQRGAVGCVDEITTYFYTTIIGWDAVTTTTITGPTPTLTTTLLQTSVTTLLNATSTVLVTTTLNANLTGTITRTFTIPTVVSVNGPTTTQSSACAPTNLISRGPDGYPVRLLLFGNCTSGQGPCSGVPGAQLTDTSSVVDPSDCCQLCMDTPGCAGSWSTNSSGIGTTCELINSGCGTSAFWYLEAGCEGDAVGTWVQRGCGSITYGGNFCPAPL